MKPYASRAPWYLLVNKRHIKKVYPLIYELFWDEWVLECAERELKLTGNYENTVPDNSKKIMNEMSQELYDSFTKKELLDHMTIQLTEQKINLNPIPISFYSDYFLEYTDESLRYFVKNCWMTAIELHMILKARNAKNNWWYSRCPVFYLARPIIAVKWFLNKVKSLVEKK